MPATLLRPPATGRLTRAGLTAFALACAAWLTGPARAEDKPLPGLNEALLQNAETAIAKLREAKCANVGVLKFLVKKGDQLSDNVGPLNQRLADRLEVALVLKNADDKFGIITHASDAVAEKNRRANHLSEEGRKALFDRKNYPLAWLSADADKNKGVPADAFVTGDVAFSPDKQKVTVRLKAFKSDGKEFDLAEFSAAADARTLTEAGLGAFRGKGGTFAGGTWQQVETGKPVGHQENVDVELRIYYDNKLQRIETRGELSEVPEPRAGQKVHFVLANKSKTDRYGAVLRVNGESTLFKEKDDALRCHMWVLGAGKEVTIRGYQLNDKEFAEFEVLPVWKSAAAKVNYGQHAGTFTLEVFRQGDSGDIKPASLSEEVAAVTHRELPRDKHKDGSGKEVDPRPGSLSSLKDALTKQEIAGPADKDVRGRGFLGAGDKKPGEVDRTAFKPHPKPELFATIYYCKQ